MGNTRKKVSGRHWCSRGADEDPPAFKAKQTKPVTTTRIVNIAVVLAN